MLDIEQMIANLQFTTPEKPGNKRTLRDTYMDTPQKEEIGKLGRGEEAGRGEHESSKGQVQGKTERESKKEKP